MSDTDNSTARKPKKKGIVRRTAGRAYSFLGFKDVANGISTQLDNAADTAERSKKLVSLYKNALRKKQNVRVETFKEAVSRMGLTDAHLAARSRELSFTSYVYMAIFAATFYFMIDSVLSDKLVNAFTLLTLSATMGALIFSTRFRVWQIETRYLGAPIEYLRSLLGKS